MSRTASMVTALKDLPQRRVFWPVAGLAVLFLFDAVFLHGFFRLEVRDGHLYGVPVDILNQGARVMLLSLGMTLVIATGGVDLSVGSLMAVAGALCAWIVTRTHLGFPAAAALALAACAVLGAWNGLLTAVLRIQPIVATLTLMVAGRGIAMLITGGQIITFHDPEFVYVGNGHLLGVPFSLFVVAAAYLMTTIVVRGSALGLFIQAVGDNARAARLCGVRTRAITGAVYVASGVCAGIAGLLAASNIKAADASRVGEMMELDAIFAVVVGGTALTGGRFTLPGSFIGALLIQTLTTTMYNLGVPPAVAPVPKALVIAAVCLVQSERFRCQVLGLLRRDAGRA